MDYFFFFFMGSLLFRIVLWLCKDKHYAMRSNEAFMDDGLEEAPCRDVAHVPCDGEETLSNMALYSKKVRVSEIKKLKDGMAPESAKRKASLAPLENSSKTRIIDRPYRKCWQKGRYKQSLLFYILMDRKYG